jgi:hypothetical protein
MANEPGIHSAALLLDTGLSFDAVVRGLVIEIGFTPAQAARAATQATAARPLGSTRELGASFGSRARAL